MSKAAELANLIGSINAGGGGVNRNVIINGAMNVAQRGTSETGVGGSNGYFTVDRFQFANVDTNGRYTVTQDSSAPAGFANSTKLDCTTADTSVASTELIKFRQKIEGQNLQGFAKGTSDAKPFAVSFYVKGNASATYACELLDQDNDRQITKLFSVTTDWTRVELTFPADTTGTFDDDNAQSMQIQFVLHSGSAYTSGTLNSDAWAATSATERYGGISSFVDSTDRTFFITGIQMEVGQNPTEFEHEPVERTLLKCQRYFRIFTSDESVNNFTRIGMGLALNSTSGIAQIHTGTRFRATPSVSSTGQLQAHNGSNLANCDVAIENGANPQNANISITNSSGFAAKDPMELVTDNVTGVIFELSSEL
jgi:hypothetical protein